MIARPCTCDKYAPRRPYRPRRDCHKCWLYAHRKPIRLAWGGDPTETLPVDFVRPDMTVAELADLLADHPTELPEGWKFWPVTREAHLLLVKRFLANMPPYTVGQFAGRGAVICGGGRYEASVYVACRMLRHVGWEHPIQIWHRGAVEPVSDRVRKLQGVEVIDILNHATRRNRTMNGGWESKTLAILESPFEEVLFMDADCYPVYNPDECFESQNNPHGIVAWPDGPCGETNIHWPTYALTPNDRPLNGGHYVFTKEKAWSVLQLAHHYDTHSNYYYTYTTTDVRVGGLGDQEQMRAAIRKLNFEITRYTEEPLSLANNSFLQAGPGGRPLFVHRQSNKFGAVNDFPLPPQWFPCGLPMEVTAWKYFLEWLSTTVDSPAFPSEVPGLFSQSECRLWHDTCRERYVLDLGRDNCRSTIVSASSARKVVSIDRLGSTDAEAWLQRYNLRHKVWLREGEIATLLPTSGGPFSACQIGGALHADIRTNIATVVPHLLPLARVGIHHYGDPAFPEVKSAIDEAVARYGWREVDRSDHLAVFQTPPK